LVHFAYRVPAIAQRLSIVIVDIRGLKIAEIPLQAAQGTAVWQGKNAAPAGIYLYKLHDGNRLIDWGKLVLLQ
jgi:hypothetical protein